MPLSKRQAQCARPTGAEAALHQAALGRRAGKAKRTAEMDERFVVPAKLGKEHAAGRFDVRTAVDRGQRGEQLTVWHLRAEIASLHATAATAADTDWPRIAAIYDHLCVLDPSPVVELARAVAIGRADGAAAGLAALPAIDGSPYVEAARGVFLAELGRHDEAQSHFRRALGLARTTPERRLMQRRLAGLAT